MLLLAAEGLTDKEIAKHLALSQRTIGTYWERMRLKLGPFSRTQLVARFLRGDAETEGAAVYDSLFAQWDEGVWIVDPAGATVYANAKTTSLLGFESGQLEQKRAWDVLRGEAADELRETCESGPHVAELPRNSGGWLRMASSPVVDSRGKCQAIVIRISDATRYRSALTKYAEALELLAQRSNDLVVRFDRDTRCLALSPAAPRLLGVSPEEVLGKKLDELADVFQPIERWREFVHRAVKTGEGQSFEAEFPGLDGEARTHVLPVAPASSGPVPVVCVVTPIFGSK